MKKFRTIESWASSVGYVVEPGAEGYFWYSENSLECNRCESVSDVIEQIIYDIKSSYEGDQ